MTAFCAVLGVVIALLVKLIHIPWLAGGIRKMTFAENIETYSTEQLRSLTEQSARLAELGFEDALARLPILCREWRRRGLWATGAVAIADGRDRAQETRGRVRIADGPDSVDLVLTEE